ncbi:MAG: UDP-2,3-diacylglucosamine diphosphatase [Rikenellaceae bacterium]|nr:UDP-2,3-diacylglucosamine diphosphatase [Rikenellaceae bacterium]
MACYFASDVHLGMALFDIDNEERFLSWLDFVAKDAEAIFFVGDIFDFWFEYKKVIPKGYLKVLAKLELLTRKGIDIHFFPGNHDMWVKDFFISECGMIVHEKGEKFEIKGRTFYIDHGDNVGFVKGKVAVLQKIFRNKTARKLFSSLVHPDVAMKFGQSWSKNSRKNGMEKKHKFDGENEPVVKFARSLIQSGQDIDFFVFGHLHTPVEYPLSGKSTLFILGDWITGGYPVYGVMEKESFVLKEFKI